jgi:serine/threonine protein kinase
MTTNYIGQQLGNYRLLNLLGRGGFADVYLGEHIHLKSRAAIKILYTRLADELLASRILISYVSWTTVYRKALPSW